MPLGGLFQRTLLLLGKAVALRSKASLQKNKSAIKGAKNSAFKRNIIYHTRDVSRTDWRPFTLSIWANIGSASLSDQHY